MFVTMALLGAGLLFGGIYCAKMTEETEKWFLCLLLAIIMIPAGLVVPVVGTVDAFIEKEIANAIICIVIYLASLVGSFFFIRSLWW